MTQDGREKPLGGNDLGGQLRPENGLPFQDASAPLVSISVSTRNRADLLQEAVQSILDQTFADFELIICDDASSDATPQLCGRLAQADPRIRILRHEKNLGMAGNWNSGLQASRGQFICKLDDDNRYLPTFIERTLQALQTSTAGYAFTDEWFIDQDGRRDSTLSDQKSKHYYRAYLKPGLQQEGALLALRQAPGINASLFRREAIEAIGGFRSNVGGYADYDMFLHLAVAGYQPYYIPERLEEYRVHMAQNAVVMTASIDQAKDSLLILETYTFTGEAERLRRNKLSVAYSNFSRTLLLNGDVAGARRATMKAMRFAPARLKAWVALAVLCLPEKLIAGALQYRYGRKSKPALVSHP